VILAGTRWYLRFPLSARQVAELLAERGVDVSARTVLTWVQTFGPLLAKESVSFLSESGRPIAAALRSPAFARRNAALAPSTRSGTWARFVRYPSQPLASQVSGTSATPSGESCGRRPLGSAHNRDHHSRYDSQPEWRDAPGWSSGHI
jgi:hypothetical protein